MGKNDFFIGWQEKLPGTSKKSIRRLLIIFTIFSIATIAIFVLNQSRFNDHFFQLGKIQEVTGTYFESPVPILRIKNGSLDSGISNDLLLVGYGKAGAEGIIEDIEENFGSLNGRMIKVQGSLIHGDGKSVLELTKKTGSVMDVLNEEVITPEQELNMIASTLEGEIIDPKCYFGVMKPGEGKIHKSCAIRCISGGIPPVFKVMKKNYNEYYIITGKGGAKINQSILEYVAEQVRIKGNTYETNGWKVIEIDPSNIINI